MNREERNAYMLAYYYRNRERITARRRELYPKRREQHKEEGRQYRANNKEKIKIYNKNYIQNHKEWSRRMANKNDWKIKIETLSHYSKGTPRCANCNEEDVRVLQLDHIDGKGNEHRKKIGRRGGHCFYRMLKLQGYPEGYQVLCANCNIRKLYLERNLYWE